MLFRIFQEACTNITRHANATKVEILLKETADEVELRVCDDGRGITEKEISNPKSFGLMGIKERVLSLGGEVEISGVENRGTTIWVRVSKNGMGEETGAQDSGCR